MTSTFPSLDLRESGSDDGRPFVQSLRFTYRHGLTLAGISVMWVLLSVPIVTVGPATLGAYRAILSLRERGQIDLKEVRSISGEHLIASALFGLAPLAFCGIGALYSIAPPQPGLLSSILGVVALYGGIYLAVILIPTFYSMASDDDPLSALKRGYIVTAGDLRTAVRLVLVTCTLFVVALLLTIAVVVIFPGFSMAYHIYVAEGQLASQ